jgi:hypothetical protein
MAAAPLIIMAVGTAISAASAIQQGQAAKNAANYNAQMEERNAQISRQNAAIEEEKQRRQGDLRLGSMRAGYGASGVAIEGSPLDILEQSAAQEELDALTIRYRGELGAYSSEQEATLSRYRGATAERSGYMQAGSSILMGAARGASMMKDLKGGLEKFDHTSAGGPWM